MPSYIEIIAAARRSLLIGLPPLPKRLVMPAPQLRHRLFALLALLLSGLGAPAALLFQTSCAALGEPTSSASRWLHLCWCRCCARCIRATAPGSAAPAAAGPAS